VKNSGQKFEYISGGKKSPEKIQSKRVWHKKIEQIEHTREKKAHHGQVRST
jgi:hypothetical protein